MWYAQAIRNHTQCLQWSIILIQKKHPNHQIEGNDISLYVDSTVFIRERSRGSKLEGAFSKKGTRGARIAKLNNYFAKQSQPVHLIKNGCSPEIGKKNLNNSRRKRRKSR